MVVVSLSRHHHVLGSIWPLLRKWYRVTSKVASDGRPLCYSSQLVAPGVFLPSDRPYGNGVGCVPSVWDVLQAFAFSVFSLIRRVLYKLHSSMGPLLTLIAPFSP